MDSITSHFGPFVPFTQFLAQKIKIFEKKKKTPGYIIILQLHPKNHNHLMYSSLKMMATALQVILGQFLPFYSIFVPKLKFFPKKTPQRTKNTKNHKHIWEQTFGPFLFLYSIFGPKNQNFQKIRKNA